MKVTVAKYMTPSGKFIEREGVEPDSLIVTPNPDVLVEWAWAQLTGKVSKVQAGNRP